jgi:ribokinase
MAALGFLGSIAFDNLFSADRTPVCGERVWGRRLGRHLGGMAANQAREAARYMEGVEIIGKVGLDAEGAALRAELATRRVSSRLLMTDEREATGQSYMFLVGDDYFSIVTPGANLAITPAEAEAAVEGLAAGTLVVSLEVNLDAAAAALARARRLDLETVLIPSPPEACPSELLSAADMLILNRREAGLLLGFQTATAEQAYAEIAHLELPGRRLAITLGGKGAVLRDGQDVYSAPALSVEVVDAVGAGDAFAGAYMAAKSLDMPYQQALAVGCIAGGLAVSTLGAQVSTHTLTEVMALYETHYAEKR